MNNKELLKHLLRFTDKYTNHVDEIIYESQYGVNPIEVLKERLGEDNGSASEETT